MIYKWLLVELLLLSHGGTKAAEKDLLEWTDDNFEDELRRHDDSLVMFYAPWCGHCKRLKPEYAKAAELLASHDPPITLAKVDCTESGKATCNKYSVSGYPTLKIFARDKLSKEYNGPRDSEGIVRYMKSQVGPASKELKTVEEMDALLNSLTISVIGFFDEQDSSLSQVFHSVAKQLREKARFAHTFSKEIFERENFKNDIVIYRPKLLQNKFEDNKLIYDGDESESGIKQFIEQNYHGLVGIRTTDNIEDFKKPLVIAYYNVDYIKNPKGTNYWRNRIMKVAKEFSKNFYFAISSKDDFQHELNEFGIDHVKNDKPIILVRDEQNQKFVLQEEFSIESFAKFMKDIKAGVLEPYLKSELIPQDNSGNVKIAVAKNFDEIVTNNGKDTLIEFYAPWCGHCKKLAPVYDELGEKLSNEDVEIVKFDATANDVPHPYDVKGFPSLYWAAKDSKHRPIRYDGGRELDDLIKYIAKHSTDSLKGWDRNGKPTKSSYQEEL